jgi:general secretion pathway protein E
VKINRGDALQGEAAIIAAPEQAPAMVPAMVLDIPYAFAKKNGVVLREVGEERAQIALREGADPIALLEVRRYLAQPIEVEIADGATFDRYLAEHYSVEGSAAEMVGEMSGGHDMLGDLLPTADDLLDSADDAPVIRLINGIIAEAVRQGASDIHIEPYETGLVVRLRNDGLLQEKLRLPASVAPVVVSRIKVMARLDIAERRVRSTCAYRRCPAGQASAWCCACSTRKIPACRSTCSACPKRRWKY